MCTWLPGLDASCPRNRLRNSYTIHTHRRLYDLEASDNHSNPTNNTQRSTVTNMAIKGLSVIFSRSSDGASALSSGQIPAGTSPWLSNAVGNHHKSLHPPVLAAKKKGQSGNYSTPRFHCKMLTPGGLGGWTMRGPIVSL